MLDATATAAAVPFINVIYAHTQTEAHLKLLSIHRNIARNRPKSFKFECVFCCSVLTVCVRFFVTVVAVYQPVKKFLGVVVTTKK